MGSEWSKATLADIAEITMGQSPPGNACTIANIGLPLLNGPTEFGHYHPTPVQYTTVYKKVAQEGDILFCVRGSTTGRMNWADQKYAIGRGIASIRHKKGQDFQPFLRAVIDFHLPTLLKSATGSTFPNVSRSQLFRLEIALPPLSEQRAIAHILGTLDDKIETLRRMNETLEGIARALFKAWFVDFEPVRAKMSGRWRRGQSLPGLPADLYDLFPDRLVPSELGEIPAGWEVKSILSYAQRLSGGTPRTNEPSYWGGSIKWVSAKDVKEAQGRFIIETERTISNQGVEHSSAKVLPANTTIVTARGTVGSYCLLAEPMAINQTNYGLKASVPNGDYFVFFSLANLVEWLQKSSYGTIFDTITTKTLESSRTIFPGNALVSQFDNAVLPIMEKMRANAYQTHTLAALRDVLLPQLISGRLRVRDAEKITKKRGL